MPRPFLLILVLSSVLSEPSFGQDIPPRQGDSRMVRPFNGTDLKGWLGDDRHWSVEDGQIVGRSTEALADSTFLLLDAKVSDFRLIFEIRLPSAEQNSGVAFWGNRSSEQPDNYSFTGLVLTLPKSVSVRDLNGRGLLTSGTSESALIGEEPASEEKPEPTEAATSDWSRIEILAQGNRVRLVVNGLQKLDFRIREPERLVAGPIGFELPASDSSQEIRVRALTLELFPDERLTTLDIDEFARLSRMQRVNVDVDPQSPDVWSKNPAVVIPESVLASIRSGLNEKLIGHLVRESEAAAYYALLAKAKSLGTKQLRAAAAEFRDLRRAAPENSRHLKREPHEFPTFADLNKNPEKYHGKPVTFRGHILKLVPTDADDGNPYGMTRLYHAWLYDEHSQSNPAIIISTSRDERLEEGTEILIDHVQASGFFFKNMAYDGQDGTRFGPLIIADKLEYYPIDEAPRVFRLGRGTKIQLMAGAVIVLLILRYVWQMRRQATYEESGRQAVREIVKHGDEPPAFNNLPGSDSADADFNETAFLAETAEEIVSPEKNVSSDDFAPESGEADGGDASGGDAGGGDASGGDA